MNEYPHKVEIIIPNRKGAFALLMGFGMAFGGIAALVFGGLLGLGGGQTGRNFFFWIWRLWMCFMILLSTRFLLFSLFGKEEWSFEGDYLSRTKKLLSIYKREEYYLNLMKGVRLSEEAEIDYTAPDPIFGRRKIDNFSMMLNLNKGTLKFDYGRDTIRMGNGLSEADARYLIEVLREKKILTDENFY